MNILAGLVILATIGVAAFGIAQPDRTGQDQMMSVRAWNAASPNDRKRFFEAVRQQTAE